MSLDERLHASHLGRHDGDVLRLVFQALELGGTEGLAAQGFQDGLFELDGEGRLQAHQGHTPLAVLQSDLEAIGGVILEDLPEEPMKQDALQALLDRLDDSV